MPLINQELQNVETGIKTTASALEQIPFVEFTTTLIRGVVETLVDVSIEQMEAYADLLGVVSAGLANYQNKLLGQGTDLVSNVDSFLNDTLSIDMSGSTATVDIDETVYPNLIAVIEDIYIDELVNDQGVFSVIDNTQSAPDSGMITGSHSDSKYNALEITPPSSGTNTALSKDVLRSFVVEKLRADSKSSYDKIETLLRMGMNRLVFNKVSLKSKLTFHLDSSEFQEGDSNTVDEDIDQKTNSWGVNAFFRASGTLKNGKRKKSKKLASGIVNRSYGGGISGSYRSDKIDRQLKVTIMNEKAIAATNLSIDILGHVEIEAKSDYFPAYDPNQPISS